MLRSRLIDRNVGAVPSAMLDCAAHMLLYLDDPAGLQRAVLRHLLEKLDASRTDIGLGSAEEPMHRIAVEEWRDGAPDLGKGRQVPNKHPAVQIVWRSNGPVYLDIQNDPVLGTLRAVTLGRGARAKLACRIQDGGRVIGMVCVDAREPRGDWNGAGRDYLNLMTETFIAPILRASLDCEEVRAPLPLTAAEMAVARLVAAGMTDKQVGKMLGKSPSTIDNQLRSIRAKLNVANRTQLANACWTLL